MLALGQAAFMALPVYGTGVLDSFGISFPICVASGLIGSLLIAKIMANIFVRLPGIFLAVGTLGFGYVVEGLARAFPSVSGGASGLVLERGRQIGDNTWYGLAVIALVIGTVVYAWLVRGAFWRQLRTIHHDELVAASIGIDVVKVKEQAFLIGCAYAVVAGLLKAYYVGVIIPEDAGVDRSTEQLSMVMVGGSGHLLGPVFGTSVLQWLFVITGYMRNYELLVYGTVFFLTVLYAREGIAGWVSKLWKNFERLLDGKREPTAMSRVVSEKSWKPLQSKRVGPCLTIDNVSKRFGGLQALESISFTVEFGEIFTVVGPNGAGKSTLFNVVSGIERATTGAIHLDGQNITSLHVHQRAALIGRSFQVARLIPDLTVLENVMVRLDRISSELNERQRAGLALEHVEYFGLVNVAFRPVRELSLGQHKLIDVTRAAVGNPPLVLLDEPAVGLTLEELANFSELLTKLQARGSAIVIVEHNIDFVSSVAKRGIVLDSGRPIALGLTKEILKDPRVNEAYFGALA
jgi:branched-chain amino acid transport system permease protein